MIFHGIQALRFVAAGMVVVEHALYVENGYTGTSHLGRVGVILFFAISGFVIALQRGRPAAEFAVHRLLRIYPPYWIALAIEAILRLWRGGQTGTTAVAIFLIPTTLIGEFTAVPYWTLIFEITFYLMITAAFAIRLSDGTLTTLALIWIIAVHILGSDPASITDYAFPGAHILISAPMQVLPMGLIGGIQYKRFRTVGRPLWLITSAAAFIGSYCFQELTLDHIALMGVAVICLIIAVADISVPRVIKRLGDTSYGIYLMHFPIIVAIGPHPFVVLFSIAMVCGIMYGLFDYWLYRRLTQRTA